MNAFDRAKSATNPRVVLALDFDSEKDVLALVEQLSPSDCRLKVGKELFTACGPGLVRQLVAAGFDVFLDLKFHDIPNTVARAVQAARDLGVWMVNVHASGGIRMMEAARAALSGRSDPLLIAVTVLTSMEQQDLTGIGIATPLEEYIDMLAGLAAQAGLDGVVCSAHEAAMLKKKFGAGFCLVTPGIRPAGGEAGDQRRIVTPEDAIRNGSDFLVMGRPITHSAEPVRVLREINQAIAAL